MAPELNRRPYRLNAAPAISATPMNSVATSSEKQPPDDEARGFSSGPQEKDVFQSWTPRVHARKAS